MMIYLLASQDIPVREDLVMLLVVRKVRVLSIILLSQNQ